VIFVIFGNMILPNVADSQQQWKMNEKEAFYLMRIHIKRMRLKFHNSD
jgi:hypothetical protein